MITMLSTLDDSLQNSGAKGHMHPTIYFLLHSTTNALSSPLALRLPPHGLDEAGEVVVLPRTHLSLLRASTQPVGSLVIPGAVFGVVDSEKGGYAVVYCVRVGLKLRTPKKWRFFSIS